MKERDHEKLDVYCVELAFIGWTTNEVGIEDEGRGREEPGGEA
jgi:hypothetical protein